MPDDDLWGSGSKASARPCLCDGAPDPGARLQGLWCPLPLLAQWTRAGGREGGGGDGGEVRAAATAAVVTSEETDTRWHVLPSVRPCTLSSVVLTESWVGFDRVLGIPAQTRQGALTQNSAEMSRTGGAPLPLWSQERLR